MGKTECRTMIKNIWWWISLPFCRARRWIKDLIRSIKFGFQRMFRGYDDSETWELGYNFIDRYSKILKDFRKDTIGCPIGMSMEEWHGILDRMIYCLEMMDEETVVENLEKNASENCEPSFKEVYQTMENYKNEFFKLFSEHFYSLWW